MVSGSGVGGRRQREWHRELSICRSKKPWIACVSLLRREVGAAFITSSYHTGQNRGAESANMPPLVSDWLPKT